MDEQTELFPPEIEEEIERAFDKLRGVKFMNMAVLKAVESRDEVRQIIRELVARLMEKSRRHGENKKGTRP